MTNLPSGPIFHYYDQGNEPYFSTSVKCTSLVIRTSKYIELFCFLQVMQYLFHQLDCVPCNEVIGCLLAEGVHNSQYKQNIFSWQTGINEFRKILILTNQIFQLKKKKKCLTDQVYQKNKSSSPLTISTILISHRVYCSTSVCFRCAAQQAPPLRNMGNFSYGTQLLSAHILNILLPSHL